MAPENDFFIPEWPDKLLDVDIVKVRFVIEMQSPCVLQPADILGLGRLLRTAGRQLFDPQDTLALSQWRALFQPSLSTDPVALRKFQKPAPAFVISMPVMQKELLSVGGQFALEVLFIGTGIPLIHEFLRSLIHIGKLGLVAGEGRFEVVELLNVGPAQSEGLVWRQDEPLESLACSVQPLSWLLCQGQVHKQVRLIFTTPTRLMVNGKPLRKPALRKIFPFMLRRTTSMLHTHCQLEVLDDPATLLELIDKLEAVATGMSWSDWRLLPGRQGFSVGGFVGEMSVNGDALQDLYWVFAVASLLGIGKGATYGAGQFELSG
jgi:hypothetical protein